MRRIIALASLTSLIASAAFAAGVEGRWRTEFNDAGGYLVVEIGACGDKTCGVIVEAWKDGEKDDSYVNLGRDIITGMAPDGPNKWDDGEIWDPEEDKTYSSQMELKGDVLEVEGCIAIFCRGQDWKRVK